MSDSASFISLLLSLQGGESAFNKSQARRSRQGVVANLKLQPFFFGDRLEDHRRHRAADEPHVLRGCAAHLELMHSPPTEQGTCDVTEHTRIL